MHNVKVRVFNDMSALVMEAISEIHNCEDNQALLNNCLNLECCKSGDQSIDQVQKRSLHGSWQQQSRMKYLESTHDYNQK